MKWLVVSNVAALLALAGGLLLVFDATGHRLHVLPADASALGVVPATVLIGVVLTLLEARFIRQRMMRTKRGR